MRTLQQFYVLMLTLCLGATALANEVQKPPFADGPEAPVEKRPEQRVWTVVRAPFTFTFEFDPGIAMPDQVSTITVSAVETPKTPHPRYGSRIPLSEAKIVATVRNPAGVVTHRHKVHAVPLVEGKYAFHVTTTEKGIHEVELSGKLGDGRPLSAAVKIPVDVFPLPPELQGTGDKAAGAPRRAIRLPISK